MVIWIERTIGEQEDLLAPKVGFLNFSKFIAHDFACKLPRREVNETVNENGVGSCDQVLWTCLVRVSTSTCSLSVLTHHDLKWGKLTFLRVREQEGIINFNDRSRTDMVCSTFRYFLPIRRFTDYLTFRLGNYQLMHDMFSMEVNLDFLL